MKKIIFLLTVFFLFFIMACSAEEKPKEDKSGQLGEKCRTENVCDPTLACIADKCVSETEACERITCSSSTDNKRHGTCIVEESKAVCDCEEGYLRTGFSGTKCEPGNVCLNIICSNHGECEANANGEASCICDSGYTSIGTNCVKDTGRCADISCSDHGDCKINAETSLLECVCEEGYSPQGLNCISDDAPCDGVECSGHGTCNSSGATVVCDCENGFVASGLECIDEATNPCKDQNCSNHGECQIHSENAVCICNEGYVAGENLSCEEISSNVCENIDCGDNGTCVDNNGTAECNCDEGYISEDLACVLDIPTVCQEEGMCSDLDGNIHGKCSENLSGQPECDCDAGFFVAGLKCIEDDTSVCFEQTCSGNGVCKIDTHEGFAYCECDENFISSEDGLTCVSASSLCNGESCSGHGTCIANGYNGITCSCDDSYVALGLECITNPCASNPCSNIENVDIDETCIAHGNNSFTCLCDSAYYWDPASSTCIAYTEDNFCEEGNMYPDDTNTCICSPGYVLSSSNDFCEIESGDLCNPNPCASLLNSNCKVVNNQTICECKEGFALNLYGECVVSVCVEDPCQDDFKTVCSKDGNTYKCDCDEGYVLDGDNCVPDDSACEPNPCTGGDNMTGECRVINGSEGYTCGCDEGYYWNGSTCLACDQCPVGVNNFTGSCNYIDNQIIGYTGQVCTCTEGSYFNYGLDENMDPGADLACEEIN